jgi:hypothetical protein
MSLKIYHACITFAHRSAHGANIITDRSSSSGKFRQRFILIRRDSIKHNPFFLRDYTIYSSHKKQLFDNAYETQPLASFRVSIGSRFL